MIQIKCFYHWKLKKYDEAMSNLIINNSEVKCHIKSNSLIKKALVFPPNTKEHLINHLHHSLPEIHSTIDQSDVKI